MNPNPINAQPVSVTVGRVLDGAAWVLMGLGLLKLMTFPWMPAERLQEPDPELPVRLSVLLAVAGVLEVAVGGLILWGNRPRLCAGLLVVVGAGFSAYHVAKLWIAAEEGCACLGALPQLVPLLESYQQPLLRAVAFWLLIIGGWCVRWGAGQSVVTEDQNAQP